MATGIWTPVERSGVTVVFDDRLNIFANKPKSTALAAGTHMKFTISGCHPVFVSTAAPANDTAGFTGTAVSPGDCIVLPRVSPVYIYSPYENATVHVSVGALT
jgi:hypothetical protein